MIGRHPAPAGGRWQAPRGAPTARLAGGARALLAIALAGLAGCSRGAAPAPEHVQYVFHRAEKSYGDCSGGGARCTRIRLSWPAVIAAPSRAAQESIHSFIRVTLLEPYDGGAPLPHEDSVMARFIDDYRAFVADSVTIPTVPWKFDRTIRPLGDTLGVACLAVTESSFVGGAHPNSSTRFANFDVRTGRRLGRGDLLIEGAEGRLDSLGERAFRRARDLESDADLNAAGFWFKAGRFRLNDNLAVTREGLLFHFDPYEIGPHALGATELTLPWPEVADLVRRESPLGRGARRPGA